MAPRAATISAALALAVTACRSPAGTRALPPSTDAAASPTDDASLVTAEGETFRVRAWSFPLAHTTMSLVDLGMHAPIASALGAAGRLAINAGFFDPSGRPIGLSISAGKQLSPFSPTLSGGVLTVRDFTAQLEATESYVPAPAIFAVQSRPRLVVDSRPNISKDDGQYTDRTALCIRDEGHTIDVIVATPGPTTPGPSLYALSRYLVTQHPCTAALNLDGGPSTAAASRTRSGSADADSEAVTVVAPRGPLRYAIAFE